MTTKRNAGLNQVAKQLRADAVAWITGWQNPRTGQGTDKDKNTALTWGGGVPMTYQLLESLFAFNDLARNIVTALPEWALRHGFDLFVETTGTTLELQRVESAVHVACDELGLLPTFLEAAVWGQLLGGGLVLIGLDDGQASSQPIDFTKLRKVQWLRAVSRSEVVISAIDEDVASGRFGEPELYAVTETRAAVSETTKWHHTRVIRFGGEHTPPRMRIRNQGWDLSVLDAVISKLALHDGMWEGAGAMMTDGSQGVWKIKGLFQAVVSGQLEEIEARFRISDRARSLFGSMLLDADKEDFSYVHRQFAGLDGLLAQSAIRTAAAARMPVTVLYGQSPSGLNATGESDIRLWYDRCEQYQTFDLLPAIERVVELVFRSLEGPTAGVEPEAWAVRMRPVRKATPMEELELRARQAQIDTAYINAGVLASLEVAISRFTPEGFSTETQIELVERERGLRAAIQQLTANARLALTSSEALGSSPAGKLSAPASTGPSQAPKKVPG